jgi:serine/threonine-protein kinase
MVFIVGDRYKAISEINLGEGRNESQSKLYLAKDIKNNNMAVTLKTVKINLSKEKDLKQELFRREYLSLKRLDHEKIVKYIDSGQDEDILYLVMENYDGDTLKEYIERKEVSIEDKIKIAINIADALEYAHEKEVIHRDLKPTNIMINNPDDIRIIDFGISKILDENYKPDETVKCYMTIRYAAPEQLMRYEAKIQSDIYSFGLNIAYLISEKEPPEERAKLKNYIESIECSTNLKNLIIEMTNDKVEDRPNNVYKIKKVLEREYNNLCSKFKRLYLKFDSYTTRNLIELGKIEYRSNDHVIKFIKNDLTKSYISKNNKSGKFYIIGNEVKYTCVLEKSNTVLKIIYVSIIEDEIQWEEETSNSINVSVPWTPIANYSDIGGNNYLQSLVQEIVDEKRKGQVYNNKSEIKNDLLNKWDIYLQEEFKEVDRKKNLCNYSNFKVDDTGCKILVKIDEVGICIENGELIQLTGKNNEQITIGEFEEYYEKGLIVKLNSEINPNDLSERGKLGIDSRKNTSSLRRLSKALNSLRVSDTANRQLLDIIVEPSIVDINDVDEIEYYFQEILSRFPNSANANAVKKALATKDIFLIQGPPGTGKSTVITELTCQILNNDPNSKILITSQSNVAVDHVINKVVPLLPKQRIIRIGRSEKISTESQNLIMSEQLNKWVEEVKENSKNGLKKYLNDKYSFELNDELDTREFSDIIVCNDTKEEKQQNSTEKIISLTREWHRRLGKLDEFDEIFANKTSIIAATCLGIASRNVINDIEFDWVIVDEAARANALELLVPLVKGKKIVLVGDHRQLPPVVNTELDKFKLEERGIKQSDLEISLFEDLFNKLSDKTKVVLNSQYRMNPKISKLISDIFYPTVDISTTLSDNDREHELSWKPRRIKWVDTSNCEDPNEVPEFQSKKNPCEAKAILHELEEIERSYEKISKSGITVGVISGYDGQKKLLENLIKPKNKKKWKKVNIIIDNVDAFQGSETDLVIYSLVRCNNQNKIGFLYDSRRLNVALSRGKTGLIIVGNIGFAEIAKSFMGNPFVDIINFIKKYPKDCLIEVYHEN